MLHFYVNMFNNIKKIINIILLNKINLISFLSILFIILLFTDSKILSSISKKINNYPIVSIYNATIGAFNIKNHEFINLISDTNIYPSKDAPDLILMLGESARADHFSAYGYKYETNKYTKDIKAIKYIPNARSCRMSTSLSLSCLLTGYDSEQYFYTPNQSSIVSYAYYSGYDIYYVSSTALDVLDAFSYESKFIKKIYLSRNVINSDFYKSNDLFLVDSLKDIYKNRNKNKPIFVILHGIGSHFPYINKVDHEFYDAFSTNNHGNIDYTNNNSALCFNLKGNSYNDHVNWYDATILYTDYIIYNIINVIKGSNTLFIYTSDHGESFGEYGQPCLHGYNSQEVWNVPFLIYISDKFSTFYKDKIVNYYNNVSLIVKSNKYWPAHTTIVPSLLDCMNSHFSYNHNFSLFSKTFNAINEETGCEKFKNDLTAAPYCR